MRTYIFSLLLIALQVLTPLASHAQVTTPPNAQTLGFKNYVINPSCLINGRNITAVGTAGAATRVTGTNAIGEGPTSCQIVLNATGDKVRFLVSPLNKTLALGNCSASLAFAGTQMSGVKAYVEQDSGSGFVKIAGTDTQLVSTASAGTAGTFQPIPIPCGGASVTQTAITLELTAASAVTGNIADVRFGQNQALGNLPPSARLAFSGYFLPTCNWSRSSTTLGDFTANAACPGPTVETSEIGSLQTTDTDLPQFTVNNLPAGTYKVTMQPVLYASTTTNTAVGISDGITSCSHNAIDASVGVGLPVTCIFVYTAPGNRTFKLQGRSSSGTVYAHTSVVNANFRFWADYYPSASSGTTAVRADQTNYDWTAYVPTTSGIGSPTFGACHHKREGPDLLIRCNGTTGTVSASVMAFSLPNGLTASDKYPTAGGTAWANVGTILRQITTGNKNFAVIMRAGESFLYLGDLDKSSSIGPMTPANGNALYNTGEQFAINARVSIQGWTENQKAPPLIGGVLTGSSGVERFERFSFGNAGGTLGGPTLCTTTNCTVYFSTIPGLAVTFNGTNLYTVTVPAGTFSGLWWCSPTALPTAGGRGVMDIIWNAASATTFQFATYRSSNYAAEAANGAFICGGPR